jgi:iron complex transport system ATP-binding protein
MIEIKDLNFSLNQFPILKDINFKWNQGEKIGVLGPNGSGKTTLVKLLSGVYQDFEGEILLENNDIRKYPDLIRARKIAVFNQKTDLNFPFNAYQVVSLARFPHQVSSIDSEKDNEIVKKYMMEANCWHLKDRLIYSLSGGEFQRVMMAGLLVQETPIVLLDEPSNFLDYKYQQEITKLVLKMSDEYQKSVLWIAHDVNLISICDRVLMLKEGEVFYDGNMDHDKIYPYLKDLYQVEFEINENKKGEKYFNPLSI